MEMTPIAHIETDLPQKFGIPRNSFLAPHLQGRIVFEPEFALPQAVAGLEEFSHLWLLWELSLIHIYRLLEVEGNCWGNHD